MVRVCSVVWLGVLGLLLASVGDSGLDLTGLEQSASRAPAAACGRYRGKETANLSRPLANTSGLTLGGGALGVENQSFQPLGGGVIATGDLTLLDAERLPDGLVSLVE